MTDPKAPLKENCSNLPAEPHNTDVQTALDAPKVLAGIRARAKTALSTPPKEAQAASPQDSPTHPSAGHALLFTQSNTLQQELLQACTQHALCLTSFTSPEDLLASRMSIATPRLLLLDTQASFPKAFDLYRQLRQTSAFAKVPVLFLITPAQINQALEACNLQNNDYLPQPLEKDVLHSKIKHLLQPLTTSEGKQKRFSPGELLDRRYEVIRFLGQGGMGQVYQVRDLKEGGRELAFKLLFDDDPNDAPPAKSAGPSAAQRRFQKEIEVLRSLDHPNIVKVYGFGTHQQFAYYTMEHLSGGCLADLIDEKGALSHLQALQILIPIASALHSAHKHDFLHRDLKPGNIMFRRGGIPVLTDFGLALHIEAAQTRLTKQGNIIGTVQYMSPEQIISPQSLDARSDIYALGAMFFEMLTGQPPFHGDDPLDIIRQILAQREPPDPRTYNSTIPTQVAAFCRCALAKDRNKRFPSAAAMVAAAARLLTQG